MIRSKSNRINMGATPSSAKPSHPAAANRHANGAREVSIQNPTVETAHTQTGAATPIPTARMSRVFTNVAEDVLIRDLESEQATHDQKSWQHKGGRQCGDGNDYA